MSEKRVISAESVTEGHPDKVCDKISDAILDDVLSKDKNARVACETAVKNGGVMVFGEMTTEAYVDVPTIVRNVLKDIGYTDASYGIDYETASIWVQVTEQSPDIAQGVGHDNKSEVGAGDQGLMIGYASDETENLMPMPSYLAHLLCRKLTEARKSGKLPYLRPDGKSQVSVEYEDGRPVRIDAVVVSAQHSEDISQTELHDDILQFVITPVCGHMMDKNTNVLVNPSGRFVRGGPYADAGLTGRKIIVDAYGGSARHGGGAFSGKDPTKVDRSAAYAARYIAKNIVASGIASQCEVQLSYAIGVADPTSVNINTNGTSNYPDHEIEAVVRKYFPLRPHSIIEKLDLLSPRYYDISAYGHFGRDDVTLPWESTNLAEFIKKRMSAQSSLDKFD
ncbi:MAG: methionine adenosyltransferase [Candidatus Woesearchaeota archaeon]